MWFARLLADDRLAAAEFAGQPISDVVFIFGFKPGEFRFNAVRLDFKTA
jgi:hypothetical protein